VANPDGEQDLEGEVSRWVLWGSPEASPGSNQRHEGDRFRKGPKAPSGGEALKENPMSGNGMKQGRKVLEDVNRQEGEKPWSRKVSGEASPSEPGFQS